MAFAQKLHELRIANRLSLQQVGDKVGISKAHVWNLEKGQTDNPSMELVIKLAELFRVPVAELVGENPEGASEDPEVVAMFRDLKKLGADDREIIKGLMAQLHDRQKKQE